MAVETTFACLRCQGELRSMGISDIRVGGMSGGWQFLIGNWAEVSEDVLRLEILVCRTCGTVEMRVPGAPASTSPSEASGTGTQWDDVWGAHDRRNVDDTGGG
ncbi:MAG TPA: hypothetical protein VLA82_03460 [Actinomycetota bacterium]|nr:hypothetical protein [Actinomycetota bacterium]